MSENAGSAKAIDETKDFNRGRNRRNASRGSKANQSAGRSLNMAELRELANLVDEHGFTDFEFENANIRVRLSKNPAPQFIQAFQPVSPGASVAPPALSQSVSSQAQAEASSAEAETSTETDADLYKINSPIVGTFYRSPSPDKEPYVKEGSVVSPETTVCIVEAMKLMNEIQAEVSGEVVKIYVENGQPVEYGQPLFGIRK
jgi:acetyl-CoA carboxylase biotin carboxyl carrier protein